MDRIQSTARQSAVTPRTLNFDDEAGPSSPIRPTQEEEPEEQFKDDEFLADILLNRPRAKHFLVLSNLNSAIQLKLLTHKEKAKPKPDSKKPTSLAQERNQMMSFLKGQGYKNLQKLRYPQMKELYDKVQESIKDSLRILFYLGSKKKSNVYRIEDAKRPLRKIKSYRIIDFEKSAQDRESLEAISMITEFKNQEDWEIIRWQLNESSGVDTLELEDGTMLHMLTEKRYPLSRELMIRMLDHGMEVKDDSETAITLIHLFILWTTEDGGDS
ncbi:hypothetical protein Tco_0191410 [Tanacetum coccineum]